MTEHFGFGVCVSVQESNTPEMEEKAVTSHSFSLIYAYVLFLKHSSGVTFHPSAQGRILFYLITFYYFSFNP